MNEHAELPTADLFEPLLETEFVVRIDEETSVTAKLVEVSRLKPATTRDDLPVRKDPFSLVFKVENEAQLAQRLYRLEHETQGNMDLFLVPVGFGEYESVFN